VGVGTGVVMGEKDGLAGSAAGTREGIRGVRGLGATTVKRIRGRKRSEESGGRVLAGSAQADEGAV
jgi:hypothetical protein